MLLWEDAEMLSGFLLMDAGRLHSCKLEYPRNRNFVPKKKKKGIKSHKNNTQPPLIHQLLNAKNILKEGYYSPL